MMKYYNNQTYIFAAAMRNESVTGTFTVDNIARGTAEVLGENRTITITNNEYSDTFSGYGIHLYRLSSLMGVEPTVPKEFAVSQNYPNPFNPSTKIDFYVAAKENIKLSIYDVLGRHILTLVDGIVTAGPQRVFWDGRDTQGKTVSSGIYFFLC
jgi:hypothetical protein